MTRTTTHRRVIRKKAMAANESKTKPANTNGSRPTGSSDSPDRLPRIKKDLDGGSCTSVHAIMEQHHEHNHRNPNNHRKSRNPWKDLLNRHTLPWGTYGSSRPSAGTADTSPGPLAAEDVPPAPETAANHGVSRGSSSGEGNTPGDPSQSSTDPQSASPDLGASQDASGVNPAADHTTSSTIPQNTSPDPCCNQAAQEATTADGTPHTDDTAHVTPAATPDTMPPWEAQLIQEWVDAQTDDPIQYMEIPPDFPIPPDTGGHATALARMLAH